VLFIIALHEYTVDERRIAGTLVILFQAHGVEVESAKFDTPESAGFMADCESLLG
jgi:hypothetical protein